MAYEKIKDVRAKFGSGELRVVLKFPKTEEPLHASGFPPERMAAILQVFNAGRDCYWDHAQWEFSTLRTADPKTAEAQSGGILKWEIRIPRHGALKVFARVGRKWFAVPCSDADLAAVIALLASPRARALNGALTNTDLPVTP